MYTYSKDSCYSNVDSFLITSIIPHMEKKTEVVTIRVTKPIRDLLERMAHKEVRSLAQQCEWLILQRLKDMGLVDEDYRPKKKLAK